jgi:hypothetical protein
MVLWTAMEGSLVTSYTYSSTSVLSFISIWGSLLQMERMVLFGSFDLLGTVNQEEFGVNVYRGV